MGTLLFSQITMWMGLALGITEGQQLVNQSFSHQCHTQRKHFILAYSHGFLNGCHQGQVNPWFSVCHQDAHGQLSMS